MSNRTRLIVLAFIVGTLVMVGALLFDNNQSAQASNQFWTTSSVGVTQTQKVVIRLYYNNQEQLNAVAGRLDIWEVHPQNSLGEGPGYVITALGPTQLEWLQSLGYRYEIDAEKTAQLQAPTAALDPRFYYFDNFNYNSNNLYMVNFLQDTTAAYPGITELLDTGDAWLATQGGYHRDMWVMRLTNEDPQYGDIAAKPTFFMVANIHAREVATPEMAIRYIKYMTSGYLGHGGYGIDPDVTWLINHHVAYIMVSFNPDGRVINEADINAYWRKNVDNANGCSDPNSWGTDQNRNSNFYWSLGGGSSPYPCDETYRGPSPSSEPETTAFQTFAATIFQDWNGNNGDDQIVISPDNASGMFITLHAYADDVLWPFGFAPGAAPNNAQLKTIGRKLADISGTLVPTGYVGYPTDGTSDDWIYGHLGVAAFTYEIGPNYGSCGDFFPNYGCIDGTGGMPRNFWGEMGPSLVYANKIAATPYITSYGPDTQNLAVDPSSVPAGLPVNLTGTVVDQRYQSDPLVPISAAEYFIDAPGAEGTGTALSPSDGAWGGTTENVEGIVDTADLLAGQHYILVHGKNQNNVWGPFTAIFLDITTPSYGVVLSPETATAQGDPGTTLTYHLQITNIGQNSDTYAISVDSTWAFDAPLTIGPIAPAGTENFDVSVTVPADANNGESDTAAVTATSQFDPGISAVSNLTTTANFYALALTPPTAEGSGDPGGQVAYVLHLTNNGNTADTFDLDSTSLWTVTQPASVGPLQPGASTDISVLVDVPLDAVPGDFDTATIQATSQGNNSATASSMLTTSVTTVYSFEVVPVADTLVAHGRDTTVQFSVVITNTGNIADSYDIHVVPGGWPVDAPAQVGPINIGASVTVAITVHVPLDISMGDSNNTTLNIISHGSSSGHVVSLHTDTFWYSTFIPISQKH